MMTISVTVSGHEIGSELKDDAEELALALVHIAHADVAELCEYISYATREDKDALKAFLIEVANGIE